MSDECDEADPVAFSLFNTAPGPGGTRVPLLLDRSAGSKTDPIEMTVIMRATTGCPIVAVIAPTKM